MKCSREGMLVNAQRVDGRETFQRQGSIPGQRQKKRCPLKYTTISGHRQRPNITSYQRDYLIYQLLPNQ